MNMGVLTPLVSWTNMVSDLSGPMKTKEGGGNDDSDSYDDAGMMTAILAAV